MKYILFITFIILFSGCSQKNIYQTFQDKAKKEGVNYKTLMAICKHESGHKDYVINVNKSIFDIQRGSHYFDTWIAANAYMDFVLDPLNLNYDIGICQINSQHLERYNLDNEDLLDRDKNIEIAAKIYNWNVKACNGRLVCALSLYNTGYKNSSIGRKYAKKVIKIRKQMFAN